MLTSTKPGYYEATHQDDYSLQEKIRDLIAFISQTNGYIIHYGQTMKAADKENFKQNMNKQCMDHCERKKWKIHLIEKVPEGEKVLDDVWAMRRKRNILTKKI